ncbi:uncharacterized protein ARMOST_20269 [Armillaria ostoyae]|uniref:Uncharacterized protein n=1 Tax=Armillaria ostoyae TaxID=47428 RepID=A0A284S6W2_ARMOS|nr:uncharacterized protein ARMOST_20269 [Armillaria ostoyae]
MSPVLGHFEAAIEQLKIVAEREHFKGHSTNTMCDYHAIEVDRILSCSVDQLLADLSVAYHDQATDTQPIIGYFTDVHVYGESVAKELDTQILQADEAYRNIPWWEYRPILSLFVEGALNVKPRRESATAYFDFLSKNEHDIRNLVEHAAIFYDHLTIFERCAQWHSNCLATVRDLVTNLIFTRPNRPHYRGIQASLPPRNFLAPWSTLGNALNISLLGMSVTLHPTEWQKGLL